jgi:hypothetical protein
MGSHGWASELATCLVGERLELPDSLPDARGVLEALAERGWPSERIVAVAHGRWDREEEWPFPASRDVLAAGPAQWYALLGHARSLLGLDGVSQPPTTRTALNADERRLLSDAPPHWGRTR